ncbi:MAG: methionyl-tRNA formyltransferase [Gammaproteobacteria bacterium]|jgi:methionyl-tRNA formyltransferase|nr:methionyl-tRNA formyltransferase [Gammaproteobacteria bacterium]
MQTDDERRLAVVFAGTPEFAVPSLQRLRSDPRVEVIAVYTQPDRPAGRSRLIMPGAVKKAAVDLSIPVFQPASLKTHDQIEAFRSLAAEVFVVAAYGLLLPQAIIEQPRLALNVHASLLPRWRGAAPIQRAIMAGDEETGISIMRVVEALDAGPVLLRRSCKIDDGDTAGTLHDKLAVLGADCLEDTIDAFLTDRLVEAAQEEAGVVYAAKISSDDRILDWTRAASELARQVRALNPAPVSTTQFGTTRIKVWSAKVVEAAVTARPGAIMAANEDGIDIATADGVLRITELQPEGKRRMNAVEFVNGFGQLLAPT